MNDVSAAAKTLARADIEAVAATAGLSMNELLEWGLYSVLETFGGNNGHPGEARAELESLRSREGSAEIDLLPKNPLAEFAADAGALHDGELAELALLTAVDMLKNSAFKETQPKDILCSFRQRKGPLLPSFRHERVEIRPAMERLFYVCPRNVSASQSDGISSLDVRAEHLFLAQSIQHAFAQNSWEECFAELEIAESVVRYCPALQQEAAAISALIDAERVLSNFCSAVDNA